MANAWVFLADLPELRRPLEVVDLSTCMTAPFGTMAEGLDTAGKREACRPEVYRYRWETTGAVATT